METRTLLHTCCYYCDNLITLFNSVVRPQSSAIATSKCIWTSLFVCVTNIFSKDNSVSSPPDYDNNVERFFAWLTATHPTVKRLFELVGAIRHLFAAWLHLPPSHRNFLLWRLYFDTKSEMLPSYLLLSGVRSRNPDCAHLVGELAWLNTGLCASITWLLRIREMRVNLRSGQYPMFDRLPDRRRFKSRMRVIMLQTVCNLFR